jgi:hypothetical protein
MSVCYLFGEPDADALETLMTNFDIADVKAGESRAAMMYNLQRIEVAEQAIQRIEDPKERKKYSDWLHFFRVKTEAGLQSSQ